MGKRMSRKSMKRKGKKSCGGKRTKRKGKKKKGGQLFDNMPGKQFKKGIKVAEKIPGEAVSLTEKGVSTGVDVVEDIGKIGLKVGRTSTKLGKKGFKFLTGKKKKGKKSKSKKGSYRAFLSKELKKVKKAHPTWPQSKVFKEAVKGWKK